MLTNKTREEQIKLMGSTHLPSGINELYKQGIFSESDKQNYAAKQRINSVYQNIEMLKVRSQIKQLLFEGREKEIGPSFKMLKQQIINHSDQEFQEYLENDRYSKQEAD